MLNFFREDTRVKISFDVKIPKRDDRVYTFYWECGDENYAGLLADCIEREFDRRVMKARAEAYEQGYKDAKAKRAKRTWFSCILGV